MITAIVLAAGLAKRAGGPKILWPIGQKSSISMVIECAKKCASVAEIIVVTGAYEKEVRQNIRDASILLVHNPFFAQGQATSLKAGLGALKPNTKAVIFLLADQPLIKPELLEALISIWQKGSAKIVAPVFQGERKNPVLFDLDFCRADFFQLTGDAGARSLLKKYERELALYQSPGPSEMFLDFDNESDYQHVKLCATDH